MELTNTQKDFLTGITQMVAFAVKADQEVVQEEMEMVQYLLTKAFPEEYVLVFVKRQIMTSMVRKLTAESIAEKILPFLGKKADLIILVHFLLNMIGSDNQLADSELSALSRLFEQLGFASGEYNLVNEIFFRSNTDTVVARNAVTEIQAQYPDLGKAYAEIFEEYHMVGGCKFGDEVYTFLSRRLRELE